MEKKFEWSLVVGLILTPWILWAIGAGIGMLIKGFCFASGVCS